VITRFNVASGPAFHMHMQGVFGGLPWAALAFAILYLQLLGLSDLLASGIVACAMVSAAAGAIMLKRGAFMNPSTPVSTNVHTLLARTTGSRHCLNQHGPTYGSMQAVS
jgi:hypothetical protein